MYRYFVFLLAKIRFQRLTHRVRRALEDFALSAWGDPASWVWLPRPRYHNEEAKVHSHHWLGTIYKQAPRLQPDMITTEDGLAVYLEGSDTLFVSTFRDYGYNIENTSIAYLTVTELTYKTGTTDDELRVGIKQLYGFLESNPIQIVRRGTERPSANEKIIELAPGFQLVQRILAKHS
jgi:hypothetical protein